MFRLNSFVRFRSNMKFIWFVFVFIMFCKYDVLVGTETLQYVTITPSLMTYRTLGYSCAFSSQPSPSPGVCLKKRCWDNFQFCQKTVAVFSALACDMRQDACYNCGCTETNCHIVSYFVLKINWRQSVTSIANVFTFHVVVIIFWVAEIGWSLRARVRSRGSSPVRARHHSFLQILQILSHIYPEPYWSGYRGLFLCF